MAFLKLVAIGFLGLSIVYISLSAFAASVRRERLEKMYDADPELDQSRAAFVEKRMATYQRKLKLRLLFLVYAVPVAVWAFIVYVINTN